MLLTNELPTSLRIILAPLTEEVHRGNWVNSWTRRVNVTNGKLNLIASEGPLPTMDGNKSRPKAQVEKMSVSGVLLQTVPTNLQSKLTFQAKWLFATLS